MEAPGKQDLWLRQKPEVLEVLREQAIVQSAESSNRIEGVTIAPERLRPVVLGGARPRDRSEEEVAGYRKALAWVHTRTRPVAVEPRLVLHLHAFVQGGSSVRLGVFLLWGCIRAVFRHGTRRGLDLRRVAAAQLDR